MKKKYDNLYSVHHFSKSKIPIPSPSQFINNVVLPPEKHRKVPNQGTEHLNPLIMLRLIVTRYIVLSNTILWISHECCVFMS